MEFQVIETYVNTSNKTFVEFFFSYSSEEQKRNKERLFNVLNRLRDYSSSFQNHLVV
jgi:hypothetical protein